MALFRGSGTAEGDSKPPARVLLEGCSDERLVALAGDGDKLAFELLVRRYEPALLAHAARLMPRARAEDAVQQALFAAWIALQRGTLVREPRPWLFQIVKNTALRMRRAGGDEQQLTDSLVSRETTVECAERKAAVRGTLAALLRLPHQQRAALVQTSVEGRSQSEVAAALGVSDTAVRGLVYRARKGLRAAAGALSPWPALTRLLRAGRAPVDRFAGPDAASGGEALSLLAKGGAVALATGVVAVGGVSVHRVLGAPPPRGHHARSASADAAAPAAGAALPTTLARLGAGPAEQDRARASRRPIGMAPGARPSGPVSTSPPTAGEMGPRVAATSPADAGGHPSEAQQPVRERSEAAPHEEAGEVSGATAGEAAHDAQSPEEPAEAPPPAAGGSGDGHEAGGEEPEGGASSDEPGAEPAGSEVGG